MKPPKQRWIWITQSYQSKYRNIHIKVGDAYEKDMENELYFPNTPEGMKNAENLLKEMKKCIYEFYKKCPSFKPKWLNEQWASELNCN